MVSKCIELGLSCTYNRPRHSNDNAHMEASFRLLKHGHEVLIPESFDSLKHAREWVNEYYNWYNNKHRHSGICFITPQDCYEGKGEAIMAKRNKIMDEFYKTHSEQKNLAEATGKRKYWKMPKNAVVMPFYTKRSKVKNKIRAQKLDSGKCANIGKSDELKLAS
ncbi:integrase core domain-containing protein [Succinivibrio sp.]|uniref:integrase core domain-containing protein n=1 Tax=Succinivibrio sp. TaxID=2053619 RepID=UPI00386AA717